MDAVHTCVGVVGGNPKTVRHPNKTELGGCILFHGHNPRVVDAFWKNSLVANANEDVWLGGMMEEVGTATQISSTLVFGC